VGTGLIAGALALAAFTSIMAARRRFKKK
jgi:hypothetical protein